VVRIMEDARLVWASVWYCWLVCDVELWVDCRAIGSELECYNRGFSYIELFEVGLWSVWSQI